MSDTCSFDGQPASMLIRGGELRGVPQVCAFSVHFCNLAGWAWNVCMKRELPHVRRNSCLDDRLVCAGSCDPLPKALEITRQVDDYFGAALNSKKGAPGPRQNSRRVVAGSFVNSLIAPGHFCIWVLMCSCVVPHGASLVCE